MVADVVLSISRKPVEKSTGIGRMFVAKNRAGRDGILFPIKINTATSTFETLSESSEMSLDEVIKSTKTSAKDLLKQKWKEVNGS
jgi:hypothetical protein